MLVLLEDIEQAKNNTLYFEIEEYVSGVETTEPVQAFLTVKKLGGGFIKIFGKISANVKAVCDNCLKNFTLPLNIEVDEMFAENTLYEEYKGEIEIKDNFFAEDLNGAKEIDLSDLMYQSLILSMPNKYVCDINCNGNEDVKKYIKDEIQDPRLEVFKTIKTEKDN